MPANSAESRWAFKFLQGKGMPPSTARPLAPREVRAARMEGGDPMLACSEIMEAKASPDSPGDHLPPEPGTELASGEVKEARLRARAAKLNSASSEACAGFAEGVEGSCSCVSPPPLPLEGVATEGAGLTSSACCSLATSSRRGFGSPPSTAVGAAASPRAVCRGGLPVGRSPWPSLGGGTGGSGDRPPAPRPLRGLASPTSLSPNS
mmetsp:Transcript_3379/g.10430  ORF Transcript_3379/g.10430 Transcript_3379/m.10430 type:complete len:207 (-) Transcript_3379:588-1208(-)